jgi:hypothetical protein
MIEKRYNTTRIKKERKKLTNISFTYSLLAFFFQKKNKRNNNKKEIFQWL